MCQLLRLADCPLPPAQVQSLLKLGIVFIPYDFQLSSATVSITALHVSPPYSLEPYALKYLAQGLAYSVSGGWNSSPLDHPGLFVAGGETAAPAEFLAAVQKVLEVSDSWCYPGQREIEPKADIHYCIPK